MADTDPAASGAKLTVMVSGTPAAIVRGVEGNVDGKRVGSLSLTKLSVTSCVPVFVNVSVWDVEVVPLSTAPKSIVVADTSSAGVSKMLAPPVTLPTVDDTSSTTEPASKFQWPSRLAPVTTVSVFISAWISVSVSALFHTRTSSMSAFRKSPDHPPDAVESMPPNCSGDVAVNGPPETTHVAFATPSM